MHMNKLLLIISVLVLLHDPVQAGISSHVTVTHSETCGIKQQVLVITGKSLPGLMGKPVNRISLFKWNGVTLEQIPFQIDQRDEKNRYVLPDTDNAGRVSDASHFDNNDELTLLPKDAGERMALLPGNLGQDALMEMELKNSKSTGSRWLYVKSDISHAMTSARTYIHYSAALNTVGTDGFEIGFSSATPFLIDRLRWRTDSADGWSLDVVDTMKIRHTGKLFGFIDFERNATDYHSRLVAIKQGPIRIIRRTENQVSMFWKLKSPSVLVDYVITPDGFTMDTIIDIPFSVGLFFSDLVTLTTVDWNSAENLPVLTINSGNQHNRLVVDGHMSAEKMAFNSLDQNTLSIDSSLGNLQVTLTIPDDFPIVSQLYLRDDITEINSPEQDAGQFGNVGFTTTGWENINTEVHHLEFNACLASKRSAVLLPN